MPDSRQHARKAVHPPVAFHVGDDGARVDAVCHDVSLGGMFIETQTPAAFGARVLIKTLLPGVEGEVTIPATVRWTTKTGMGVQFGSMGARETRGLMKLVA